MDYIEKDVVVVGVVAVVHVAEANTVDVVDAYQWVYSKELQLAGLWAHVEQSFQLEQIARE
jgi:hypothetical protein